MNPRSARQCLALLFCLALVFGTVGTASAKSVTSSKGDILLAVRWRIWLCLEEQQFRPFGLY